MIKEYFTKIENLLIPRVWIGLGSGNIGDIVKILIILSCSKQHS